MPQDTWDRAQPFEWSPTRFGQIDAHVETLRTEVASLRKWKTGIVIAMATAYGGGLVIAWQLTQFGPKITEAIATTLSAHYVTHDELRKCIKKPSDC
jgi:hypothetical protein